MPARCLPEFRQRGFTPPVNLECCLAETEKQKYRYGKSRADLGPSGIIAPEKPPPTEIILTKTICV